MTLPRTVRGSLPPFLLALALAVVLALPTTALGSAWVGQQTVSVINNRGAQPPQPQIGIDAPGNATLAMAADKLPLFVQSATRPVGAGWAGVGELGTVPATTGVPSLAVDPAGNALLAWADSSATAPCTGAVNGCLRIFSRPAGSSGFQSEKAFAIPTAITDIHVALDASGSGAGAIVWHTSPSPNAHTIFGASRTSAGAWGAAQTMWNNNTEIPSQLSLAMDDSGRPVVIWATTGLAGACPCSVRQSLAFAPAGTLVPSVNISPFTNVSVQRNLQGAVDAVWVRSDPTSTVRTLNTAAIAAGAPSFGTVETVLTTTTAHSLVGSHVVTAADGEAVALWTDIISGITVVRSVAAATKAPGAAWVPIGGLDANTAEPGGPALVMDAAGDATAIWRNAVTGTLRYAAHPHGGTFGGTFDGPAAAAPPVAAVDPAGDVHAAWSQTALTVDTAVLDAGAPTVTTTALPAATFTAGSPVPFAATTADAWSAPVSVQWDFGDGTTGTGDSASHIYSAPGQYTARATGTDASGNSSSTTQTVTITQVPGGLSNPIRGRTVNLEPISGTVLVRIPGSTTFVPLVTPTQVVNGAIIDARKGRVRITIDNGKGGFDTAEFYGGIFRFTQPTAKAGQLWFANLYLYGGSFKGCARAPRNPQIAALSKAKRKAQLKPDRTVRQLWGSGEGAFRTVGRFSSATVRGTTWLTNDRCDGTLTKVTAGKVGVRDFVLRKTVLLKARHSYLARPRATTSAKARARARARAKARRR